MSCRRRKVEKALGFLIEMISKMSEVNVLKDVKLFIQALFS